MSNPIIASTLPPVVVAPCAQGATFSRTVTYKEDGVAVNFTGYTGTAEVRAVPSGQVVAIFAVTFPPTTGQITVSGTAAQMAELEGKYICRVFGTIGGVVTALIDYEMLVTAPKP